MIVLARPAAVRAAFHIRAAEEYRAAFTWIRLEAPPEGETLGPMIATDGVAMIIAEAAHDSPETIHVRPEGRWSIPKNGLAFRIRTDGEKGELLIEKRNSHEIRPLQVETPESVSAWPDYRRIVPDARAGTRVLSGPLDSIKAGRIAEAYQGTATRYGQIGAAWYPMPGGRHAYLGGTDPADLVLLTPLAGPATEGWVTEADS